MPPNANIVNASIDDYLLALADGVYQAQRQLSRVSVEGQPGQPSITYQLPRVDFEFRVTFALSQSDPRGGDDEGKKVIQISPAGEGGTRSASVASTIKGSFIAVPAGGGKPPSVLSTRLADHSRDGTRRHGVTADVRSGAGEPLGDVEVQFNIDREMTRRLTEANGLVFTDLRAGTRLWFGVRHTDGRGAAQNILDIDASEPAGTCVAVQVDAVDESELIVFEVPRP